jgi:hypothetical protein
MEQEALSDWASPSAKGNRKKTRKQRHKEEQTYKQVQATPEVEVVEPVESEAEQATQTESEFADIEAYCRKIANVLWT